MSTLVRFALLAGAIALPAYADALRPPPPMDCGNVTAHGQCSGSTVTYCDTSVTPNILVIIDCTQFGMGAQCVDDPNAAHPSCASPMGGPCLELDPNGNTTSIRCGGTDPGCLEAPASSACTDNLGACVAADIGSCRNNRLMLGCLDTQPWLLDCPAFGAQCSNGLCVGAGVGQVCNMNVQCAAGLVCGRLSRCEAPPDAGVPIVDASAPDAAPPAPDAAPVAPDAEPAHDVPLATTDAGPSAPDAAARDATTPGDPPVGLDASVAAADAADGLTSEGASECSCRTTGDQGAPLGAALLLGLAIVVMRRRRAS